MLHSAVKNCRGKTYCRRTVNCLCDGRFLSSMQFLRMNHNRSLPQTLNLLYYARATSLTQSSSSKIVETSLSSSGFMSTTSKPTDETEIGKEPLFSTPPGLTKLTIDSTGDNSRHHNKAGTCPTGRDCPRKVCNFEILVSVHFKSRIKS